MKKCETSNCSIYRQDKENEGMPRISLAIACTANKDHVQFCATLNLNGAPLKIY